MGTVAYVCISAALILLFVIALLQVKENADKDPEPRLVTNYGPKTLANGKTSNSPVLWRQVVDGREIFWEPTPDELVDDQIDRSL